MTDPDQLPALPEKIAPVQGYSRGIPWSLHLEAYDAYRKKYGPQPALIEGWCRGGFGVSELDELVPGWRERASEIGQLRAVIATERARADALQEKFNCADLMAQCMAGLREHCIEAGVVDESVPPMMYPEEIIPRLVRADALEAALSDVLEMAQEHADHFAAAFAGYKPERHAYYARALATARALLEKKT